MKILVISQQYWPESWRIIGTCEELVNRGHDVTVVCGLPNDSEGRLVKAYHRKAMRCQEHNGVHIFRVSDHPRWRGDLNLYLKYVSFSKRASCQPIIADHASHPRHSVQRKLSLPYRDVLPRFMARKPFSSWN
jgi:hypothetical protein